MEETLDMVWSRVIREAPMPPTLKSGVDQARQLLGTTLTETVERDRGVSYNTGVVAYNNTGVVTNTRVVSNTRAYNVQMCT